jgi:3-methyladenine DNA glycosylase/8-oxoguanine DNA glycosylase
MGLKLSNRSTTETPMVLVEVFMKEIPSASQRKKIRETLADKLGANQELRAFYRMARKDPIVKYAIRDLYGMHDTDAATLFSEATLAILLQMAPLRRSQQMWGCIIRNYGETAEFDRMKILVWPTPKRLATISQNELRQRCKLGYRARHLIGTARVLSKEGFPTLEDLKKMSPSESRRKLLELPGIGDYSADIIGPYPGFPIDAWSAEVFSALFWRRQPDSGRNEINKVKTAGLKRWRTLLDGLPLCCSRFNWAFQTARPQSKTFVR